MSRIGKQILEIPMKVDAAFSGGVLTVTGPKGTLTRRMPMGITMAINDGSIKVAGEGPLWGTSAAHAANMLRGASEGFSKKLIIEGIGYRAELIGTNLNFALGFSHPVIVPIPKGIAVTVEKGMLTLTGADKEALGQFAQKIVDLKKPEPYKGKGIRYEGQVIRRKEGKKATAA